MKIFFSGAFTTIVVYFIMKFMYYLSGLNIDNLTGSELSTANFILVIAFVCGAVTETIKQIKEK